MRVLDLFCGMGGLSLGFARSGFSVVGYDLNPRVPEVFSVNGVGKARVCDLSEPGVLEAADMEDVVLVVGGPPCRPWSALNCRRRGLRHPDYQLVRVFLGFVATILPEAFLMENVTLLHYDPELDRILDVLRLRRSYHLERRIVRYSDFGAATSRQRLILAGFRRKRNSGNRAEKLFSCLEARRRPALKVGEVLDRFVGVPRGGFPDHVWPEFRTIEKYEGKYRTGRFGWYRLDPDRPAPSFGNIMKTYILHPWAGNGRGVPLRVLSVREAMAIMGFGDGFRFPEGMGMRTRYQMVADAVSPVFSEVCARAVGDLL